MLTIDTMPSGQQGAVLWITGLSGVGKTTVAQVVANRLRREGRFVVHVDGDALREALGQPHTHSPEDRRALAFTYVRLCVLLADQGATVVCSTMSLFHAVRDWGRRHAPRWFEVYLTAPLAVLRDRDPKGIYAEADAGQRPYVAAVNMEYEAPKAPDLYLVNDGTAAPDVAADGILEAFRMKEFSRGTGNT